MRSSPSAGGGAIVPPSVPPGGDTVHARGGDTGHGAPPAWWGVAVRRWVVPRCAVRGASFTWLRAGAGAGARA